MRIFFYFISFLIIALLLIFLYAFKHDAEVAYPYDKAAYKPLVIPPPVVVAEYVETPKIEPAKAEGCLWANHTSSPELAAYIFVKESGCRPEAVNGAGCRGLGQACPGGKLPCSDSDGECQAKWFENYAMNRYGSWQAAYDFKLAKGWW